MSLQRRCKHYKEYDFVMASVIKPNTKLRLLAQSLFDSSGRYVTKIVHIYLSSGVSEDVETAKLYHE